MESKEAAAAWSGFREELHGDPLLNIRRGDILRARKLAAGQGRPRIPSTGRGPSKAERWEYRKVLKRGLATIASLPGTTVGTARSGTANVPATAEAVLGRLAARHTAHGTAALAVIRTNTAAPSWYDLTPVPAAAAPPRPAQAPSHVQAGVEELLEAAEFVAYCAYQHLAHRPNRRFLWEWYPELLPEAEGPLVL
ncbi:hypothetical protein [Streptomyces sp. NPDC006134]|uniref:hypothetical protein n=1 Tax=Streptomyces sp. NPDC006134 TaxID=3154467 RepID=UPI0033F3AE8F